MLEDRSVAERIVIIDGHPDPDHRRFCHALADAYAQAAVSAGHAVRRIAVGEIEVPLLRTALDWQEGTPPEVMRGCQEAIAWADHLVIIYPLWLGTMPALLKAWFEQVFRAGFAVPRTDSGGWPTGLLKGKSARIIVTMGMPALAYRWFFLAHSLRSLERNILRFSGIGPIRNTLIGGIGSIDAGRRGRWLDKIRAHGRAGR
jgi:putative NADPH-quinone reductase